MFIIFVDVSAPFDHTVLFSLLDRDEPWALKESKQNRSVIVLITSFFIIPILFLTI